YALCLYRRRFFMPFNVLSQKTLINAYSFRKSFCIYNFIKFKELWQVQSYFQILFINGFILFLKVKIKRFQYIGFKFFQRIANSINRIFFSISRIPLFCFFNDHFYFHSAIFYYSPASFLIFFSNPLPTSWLP